MQLILISSYTIAFQLYLLTIRTVCYSFIDVSVTKLNVCMTLGSYGKFFTLLAKMFLLYENLYCVHEIISLQQLVDFVAMFL